jgi:hypothetical protein
MPTAGEKPGDEADSDIQPANIDIRGVITFQSKGGRPDMKNSHDALIEHLWGCACYRQRRRREIFIEQNSKDFQAPSGAASPVHGHHRTSKSEQQIPFQNRRGMISRICRPQWGWDFIKNSFSTNISRLRRWGSALTNAGYLKLRVLAAAP